MSDGNFYYDESLGGWVVRDVSQLTGSNLNNLQRFYQPYDPNNHYDRKFYRFDLEGIARPKLFIRQADYVGQIVGDDISFEDFDLYKNIISGKYNLQRNTTYTISELKIRGIMSPEPTPGNGINNREDALGKTFYIFLDSKDNRITGVSKKYSTIEGAYIFGSIIYNIDDDAVISISDDGKVSISGHISAVNDSFKNQSNAIEKIFSDLIDVSFGAGLGEDGDAVDIIYTGDGVFRHVEALLPHRDSEIRCFPAGTGILFADGSSRSIEDVCVDDLVTSFNRSWD